MVAICVLDVVKNSVNAFINPPLVCSIIAYFQFNIYILTLLISNVLYNVSFFLSIKIDGKKNKF